MKLLKFILPLFLLTHFCLNAQLNNNLENHDHSRCGANHKLEELLKDPIFAKEYAQTQAQTIKNQEKYFANKINKKAQMGCESTLIIPVVVHFESNTISNQCMIDATLAQINQMNLDFSGCNNNAYKFCEWISAGCDEYGGTEGTQAIPLEGSCIQFCLADQNLPADGSLIPEGYAITKGAYNPSSQNASNLWYGFFNVYVGDADGNLGFAYNVSGNPNGTTRGATILTSAFGAVDFSGCEGVGTDGTYGGGATLTHEAGHWLGLDHTFENSGNITDIPVQSEPNYSCPSVNTNNCTDNATDGYSGNFMDYVDDACMFMFTQDQVEVMLSTAAPQSAWANNTVSCVENYPACENPEGTCEVVASFEPINTSIELCILEGTSINFTDTSYPFIDSWAWSFSTTGDLNIDITSSTVQNPTVSFANDPETSGTLTASLTACSGDMCSTTSTTYTVNIVSPADCTVSCEYTLTMGDTYGDGWNGGILTFSSSLGTSTTYTHTNYNQTWVATTETINFEVEDEEVITVSYSSGEYAEEVTYSINDADGNTVLADGPNPSANGGAFIVNCPVVETCNDGILNQNETSIDCGGICGSCTGGTLELKFFLEGFYNTTTGEMTTDLVENGLVPFAQPFGTTIINYTGDESILFYPSEDIVDWVLVQARNQNDETDVIETKACFLLKNGTLMDIDGTVGVAFDNLLTDEAYYFAIFQKSHVGVLTSETLILNQGEYDFSSNSTKASGVEQQTLVDGIYALFSGDLDNNGIVNNIDYNIWAIDAAAVNQYVSYDVDGNGIVNNNDYNLWRRNSSKVGNTSIHY